MRGWIGAWSGLGVLLLAGAALAQDPATRGPLEVSEWDAGSVTADGADIPTVVVYPSTGSAFPLVGVIHGASRTGARHIELARTLASRGFVVVLPDIPCSFFSCDHAANARQIRALLEWAIAESGGSSSPIAGLIDPARRGLIGHSWGALGSHLAASGDASIDSLVLLDPNDDGTVGLDATPAVGAATAQLLASVPGTCNSAWDEAAVTSTLTAPKLQLTVSGSGHCDPEEPGDSVCPFACGSGDPATSSVFRRYAVAWTACVLTGDAAMAPWLGGASMSADEAADAIEGIVTAGLDGLPCADSVAPMDAGVVATDAGVSAGDAGIPAGSDASVVADADAGGGTPPLMDAGTGGPDAGASTDSGGCGCRAHSTGATPPIWLALCALGLLVRRRGRRREF